jgi:hypothetical protein
LETVTEIAQMLECLKRIEAHLDQINARMTNIEALLDGIITPGRALEFAEWAEPQQLHQPEQP